MFRLRKWKNFPYLTYFVGITFVVLFVDWTLSQPFFDQASSDTAGFPSILSTVFRHVFPLRYESDLYLLSIRFIEVFGVFLVIGAIEILLVRWWALKHRH